MNGHDLFDGINEPFHAYNREDMSCPVDAKPDANGSPDKQVSPPSEPEPSLSVPELLQSLVAAQLEQNELFREIIHQNAYLIGMMASDDLDEDEPSQSQYLDGSRPS